MKASPSPKARGGLLVALAGLAVWLAAGCQVQKPNAMYQPAGTPRLVELGTAICVPCAMMAPSLNELKTEYAGRLEVEVIDTLIHPGAKARYGAPFCATQIFIAPSGKELFRHVGYYSKEDILAKWKELGVDLGTPAQAQEPRRAAPAAAGGSGG